MTKRFPFEGVLAAVVTPFDASLRIDWADFDRVLDYVVRGGCTGVVIGGHTGEFSALEADEPAELVRAAIRRTEGRVPIIQGVYAESTRAAVDQACRARAAGASGILIIPPWLFGMGANEDGSAVYRFYEEVSESTDLPSVAFCYGPDYGFHPSVVADIAQLRNVAGLKIGGPVHYYEACLRSVNGCAAVLCCADSSLYGCLAVGGDGAIVALASVAPRLCVQLFESVKNGDGVRGRRINDALFGISRAMFQPPTLRMPLRAKELLLAIGVVEQAYSRPPLLPLSTWERQELSSAVYAAGIHDDVRDSAPLEEATSGARKPVRTRR